MVFALNWFAVGDHAAYWVALEKGYYKDKGLEVELQNSKGSGDSIAKVDTGRADVGLADASVVIPLVAKGAKIKVVGAVFDLTPAEHLDAQGHRHRQAQGPRGQDPGGAAGRLAAPALPGLRAHQRHRREEGDLGEHRARGQVRGAVREARGRRARLHHRQPFWEKAVGKENLVRMPWFQYGFDTYSMSIMASEKTMNERPKVLKDFLEASYRGWRDVMENPKAALAIFRKRVPEIDLTLIEPNMMLGLELMKTDRYAQNGIGWMDRAKMCRTVELINTYMDVPRKVGCDEVFTNSFLTRIEPPKSMR